MEIPKSICEYEALGIANNATATSIHLNKRMVLSVLVIAILRKKFVKSSGLGAWAQGASSSIKNIHQYARPLALRLGSRPYAINPGGRRKSHFVANALRSEDFF